MKEVPDSLQWIPASASSDVDAFRYLPFEEYGTTFGFDSDVLEVRFKRGGRVYRYHGVSERLYEDFFAATSKGKFIHAVLNHLKAERVG